MSFQNHIGRLWYPSSAFVFYLSKLLWPINLVFYIIVAIKRFLFVSGFLSSNKFPTPIIVVGNISVGGTGKTPFISELILLLKEHGITAGIVSRGYKSQCSSLPHQIKITDNVSDVGDEAFMQFRNLNVPIVIDPDRSRGVEFLIHNNEVDVIISDDGLQHYKMDRNLEFLIFDATREFGNRMIIPIGPLREPIGRLTSVDLIVANGNSRLPQADGNAKIESCCFINLKTGEEKKLDCFGNRAVAAIAGIGNPNRFFTTLSQHCEIHCKKSFDDHHGFSPSDFVDFKDEVLVMTEKDAVKCVSFARDNWYYLKVSMNFEESLKEQMLSLIQQELV